jgi:hypothetical protein
MEEPAGSRRATGTAEGWPISLLPDAWREETGEVTNRELRLDDLIEADLLPAPGRPGGPTELAWWSEGRAHAYVIAGFPSEWGDWTPEMIQQRERAEILLGEAIARDLVPAPGRQTPHGPEQDVPGGDFSPERVERKSLTRPKVVLDVFGGLAILPRHLLPNYKGHHWCSIKVDSAAAKWAFPRSLIEPEPVSPGAETEPAIADPAPAASAAPPVSSGGRPTDRDLVLGEAEWRLKHRRTQAKTLAAFAREIREWLKVHGRRRVKKTGEVMKAKTIEGHVRSLWKKYKRP